MMRTNRSHARKLAARWVRRWIFPAVEGLWSLCFSSAGRFLRPSARMIVPDGSQRVLVIAPHPDDETLGCGGAIALHARVGDFVSVLIVTDGGSSMAGGLTRAQIRPLRRAEAEAAMVKLMPPATEQDHTLHLLDFPEGMWSPEELQASLVGLLAQIKPTIIYTTSSIDFHPQHLMVAEALARSLAGAPGHTCRAIRVYELQVPLTPVLANVMLDISLVVASKAAALREYRTQRDSFHWVPRAARYLRGLYRVKGTIEVFWELEPE